MSFLSNFIEATKAPIVKPVEWPAGIADDHPIRKAGLCVRYWPLMVHEHIQSKIKEQKLLPLDDQTWGNDLFYYVIVATISDKSGNLLFVEDWPKLWKDRLLLDSGGDLAKDDNGELIIPPPDYMLLGEQLKKDFNTSQGNAILNVLWDEAMKYNTYFPDNSKN